MGVGQHDMEGGEGGEGEGDAAAAPAGAQSAVDCRALQWHAWAKAASGRDPTW